MEYFPRLCLFMAGINTLLRRTVFLSLHVSRDVFWGGGLGIQTFIYHSYLYVLHQTE